MDCNIYLENNFLAHPQSLEAILNLHVTQSVFNTSIP